MMDTVDPWEKLRKEGIVRCLTNCITFDDLAQSLIEYDILTTATVHDIQGKTEPHERNLCLLQWLSSKGDPEKYDVFICLLHMKGWHAAVKILQKEADDEPQSQDPQASGPQPVLRAFGGGGAHVPADSVGPGSSAHKTVAEAGSVEQQVIKATDLKKGDDIYPMVRCSRGKCLIINNRDFVCEKKRRCGSDVDVHRMKKLFTALLFKCEVRRNLTAKQIEEELKAAAQSKEHYDADCLVVVLMSHGDLDIIYGTDLEPVHLYEGVYAQFNNEKCRALQGKPKLFFVQACRGAYRDNGTDMTSADAISCKDPSSSGTEPAEESRAASRIASISDTYVVYATIRGHAALINSVTGSWLLSAVYNVFSQQACNKDLEALMHDVSKEMLAREAHDGEKVTPCTEPLGWQRRLYFNPGLCCAEHGPEEMRPIHCGGSPAKRKCVML